MIIVFVLWAFPWWWFFEHFFYNDRAHVNIKKSWNIIEKSKWKKGLKHPNLSLNSNMKLKLNSNNYNIHKELVSTLKITWFQVLDNTFHQQCKPCNL
jgi:hypothetical protein